MGDDAEDSRSLYSFSIFPEAGNFLSDLDFEIFLPLHKLLQAKTDTINSSAITQKHSRSSSISRYEPQASFIPDLLDDSPETERRMVYYFKQLLELPLQTLELEPVLIKTELQRNDSELNKLLYTDYQTPADFYFASRRPNTPQTTPSISPGSSQQNLKPNKPPSDKFLQPKAFSKNQEFQPSVDANMNFIFLELFNLNQKSHCSATEIKDLLTEAQDRIPATQQKGRNVVSFVSEMDGSRKLSRRLLEQQDTLIQLAEMPKLMRQYIHSGRYQEAIEIYDNMITFNREFQTLGIQSKRHISSDYSTNPTKQESPTSISPTENPLENQEPSSESSPKSLKIVKKLVENTVTKVKDIFSDLIYLILYELEGASSIPSSIFTSPKMQNNTSAMGDKFKFQNSSQTTTSFSGKDYDKSKGNYYTPRQSSFNSSSSTGNSFQDYNQTLSRRVSAISILRQANVFTESELKNIYLQTQWKSWCKHAYVLGLPLNNKLSALDGSQIFRDQKVPDFLSKSDLGSPITNPANINSSQQSMTSPFLQKNDVRSPSLRSGKLERFSNSSSVRANSSAIAQSLENYLESFTEWLIRIYNEYQTVFFGNSHSDNNEFNSNELDLLGHSITSVKPQCPLLSSLIGYACKVSTQLVKSQLEILSSNDKLLLSMIDRCSWLSEKLGRHNLDFLSQPIIPSLLNMVVSTTLSGVKTAVNESNLVFLEISNNLSACGNLNLSSQKSQKAQISCAQDSFVTNVLWHRLASSNRVIPNAPIQVVKDFLANLKAGKPNQTQTTCENPDGAIDEKSGTEQNLSLDWEELLQSYSISGVTILQYPVISALYHDFRKATLSINHLLLSDIFLGFDNTEKPVEAGAEAGCAIGTLSRIEILAIIVLCFENELVHISKSIRNLYDALDHEISVLARSPTQLNGSTTPAVPPTHTHTNEPEPTSRYEKSLLKCKKLVSECALVLLFGVARYLMDFFEELNLSFSSNKTQDSQTQQTHSGDDFTFDFEELTFLLAPCISFYFASG